MYTVIIPTMWKINKLFEKMLKVYENEELINEIIIIDNNYKNRLINIHDFKKVKLLCNNVNNYINPSWNWAVMESTNDKLIIANDDIIIDPEILHNSLLKIAEVLESGHVTVWNKHSKTNKNAGEIKVSKKLTYGNGIIFFTNKYNYVDIPDELKLYFGDNFIFNNSDINYEINMHTETPMSETIKNNKKLSELAGYEMEKYKNIYN